MAIQAFPSSEPGNLHGQPGMDLRDWLAGRIIAAIAGANDNPAQMAARAAKAYAYADLLIAVRDA